MITYICFKHFNTFLQPDILKRAGFFVFNISLQAASFLPNLSQKLTASAFKAKSQLFD